MPEVSVERLFQVVSVFESSEVDALMFDAAPESFHEGVVMVATLAVHADTDAMLLENTCEGPTGKLDTPDGSGVLWHSRASRERGSSGPQWRRQKPPGHHLGYKAVSQGIKTCFIAAADMILQLVIARK